MHLTAFGGGINGNNDTDTKTRPICYYLFIMRFRYLVPGGLRRLKNVDAIFRSYGAQLILRSSSRGRPLGETWNSEM